MQPPQLVVYYNHERAGKVGPRGKQDGSVPSVQATTWKVLSHDICNQLRYGGVYSVLCVETDTAEIVLPEGFVPVTLFTSEQPSKKAVPRN